MPEDILHNFSNLHEETKFLHGGFSSAPVIIVDCRTEEDHGPPVIAQTKRLSQMIDGPVLFSSPKEKTQDDAVRPASNFFDAVKEAFRFLASRP